MLSAKQGNYWYQFHNVFGMTRSLNPGPPTHEASTLPLGYRGGGFGDVLLAIDDGRTIDEDRSEYLTLSTFVS